METKVIVKRLNAAIEDLDRNMTTRLLFLDAGCKDLSPFDRAGMIRSARVGMLQYALEIHRAEMIDAAIERMKQAIVDAFTPKKSAL